MPNTTAYDDVRPTCREVAGVATDRADIMLNARVRADVDGSGRDHRRSHRWWPVAAPALVTCLAALMVAITGARGSDYPAHYFRATQWRANPLGTWNFQWYGGHSTFSYTIIAPPLSALFGTFTLCAFSGVAAVVLSGRLFDRYFKATAAAAATATVALLQIDNIIVGRVPFGLGFALLLATLLLWSRGRLLAAVIVAFAVGFASPVAAVMLGLIAAPVAIDQALGARHSLRAAARASSTAIAIGAAAALPLIAMALVTLGGDAPAGYFPYAAKYIAFSLLSAAAVFVAARRRVVRIGAATAFVVTVVVATVPNPLGGNLSRYTSFVVLPIATALAVERYQSRNEPTPDGALLSAGGWLRHRPIGHLVAAVLWSLAVWFTMSFTIHSIGQWAQDPSNALSYYQPLLDEVTRQQAGEPLTRLEIAFTDDHWEAAFVAPRVPYARGWERQVDLARNRVLYDPNLNADMYRQWVDDNAVGLIAVPNVALAGAGRPEARLIDDGVDWLTLVWQNDDWRLFRVEQPTPIGSGGEVTAIDANGITIQVTAPGPVSIAAVSDRRLTITPSGCLSTDENGNIVAHIDRPGEYRIVERRWAFVVGGGDFCQPSETTPLANQGRIDHPERSNRARSTNR